jgi:hypothetical protein
MKKMFILGISATAVLLSAVLCCIAADVPPVTGTYISKDDPKEYLSLYPDGTFFLKQRKQIPDIEAPFREYTGKYRIIGEDIKLETSDGGESSGKLKGNTFEDSQGRPWVKQGSEPPRPVERAKREKGIF